MAWFLLRSALCIGAVAVTASGIGPVADALDRTGRGAIERAGRACLTSSACLRAVEAATIAGAAPLLRAGRTAQGRSRSPRPDEAPPTSREAPGA